MEKEKEKETLFIISDELEFKLFLAKHLNDFSLFYNNPEVDIMEQILIMRPDCLIINIDQLSNKLIEDLTRIQEWCEQHFIPIITIVNRFEQKDRTKYLTIADVVFHHPIHLGELIASIAKHIKKRNHYLKHTLIDSLTGAYNHYYLKMEVQRQFNDMTRSHEPLSLVYLEVETGQAESSIKNHGLVKQFVSFIKNSIRPADFIGHLYGRKGFVLVLPKTVKEDARKLIERLNQLLQNEAIVFSAKIIEITDPTQSLDECFSLLSFSNRNEIGQIIDSSNGEEDSNFKKLNIGIIDDDRLIRELLKHQLEDIADDDYDLEIRSFTNGEEFFNDPWHRQNERFLLIIDRVMPKMDGLEILRKIRTEYDRNRYLCFMLTSKGSETDIALAIQKGANDYMTKPFSMKELRVRIKRLLRGSR